MRLTPHIEQAIRVAALQHKNQERKGEDGMPYIVHPFTVALMTAEYTDDENTIVAALLHDIIEDTPYTQDELRASFGERVFTLVLALTEPKIQDRKRLAWKERKQQYITNLSAADDQTKIISACDKIHNMRGMIAGREKYGENVWQKFTLSKKEYLWFFESVYTAIQRKIPNELERKYQQIYKNLKN